MWRRRQETAGDRAMPAARIGGSVPPLGCRRRLRGFNLPGAGADLEAVCGTGANLGSAARRHCTWMTFPGPPGGKYLQKRLTVIGNGAILDPQGKAVRKDGV